MEETPIQRDSSLLYVPDTLEIIKDIEAVLVRFMNSLGATKARHVQLS